MRATLLYLFAVLLTATICKSYRYPCVCLKISSTTLHVSRVKSYYIQKSGLCHITAAVLKTVRGFTVCADPKKPWVIQAMKLVDAKTRTVSTTARLSAASMPAVITSGASYKTS